MDPTRSLRRFRRLVSPPGRAAPAAVPVDRDATLAQELAAVLSAVDEVDREVTRIREEADERAQRVRDDADAEAARLLDEASETADRERADAGAARTREIEDELADLEARTDAEVAAVRATAANHHDDVVAQLVRRALDVAPTPEAVP